MSVFYPDINLERITKITADMLDSRGVKGLLIDIDNTLTHHNSQQIDEDILQWVKWAKDNYSCILLSNNNSKRVIPFAEMLGIEYMANGAKPIPSIGFRKAAAKIGLSAGEIAVVGDQIFTDIYGGNLFGATTIRVEPMRTEGGWFFNLKRAVEQKIMNGYYKKKGKIDD